MQPSRNQQPAAQPIAFAGEVPVVGPAQRKSSLEQAMAVLDQTPSIDALSDVLVLLGHMRRFARYEPKANIRIDNALLQITDAALDPNSPMHIQHWRSDHFENFRAAWKIYVQSPSSTALHNRLSDLMVAYAQSAGARDAPGAANLPLSPYHLINDLKRLDHFQQYNGGGSNYPDSFTVIYEQVRQHWPRVGAYWHPAWSMARPSPAFPSMTAKIAKEAWPTGDEEEKARILGSSDLNWLNENAANAQLPRESYFNFEQVSRFSRMSDKQFFDVLKALGDHPFALKCTLDHQYSTLESAMESLPDFSRRIQLTDQVMALAKELFTDKLDEGYYAFGYDKDFVPRIKTALLDIIANQQSTPQKGQELIHHMIKEAVGEARADLITAPASDQVLNHLKKALSALGLAAGSVNSTTSLAGDFRIAADPVYIANQVRQLGKLFSEKLDSATPHTKRGLLPVWDVPERMADIFRSLDCVTDDICGRKISGKDAGDLIKAAFVEAGLVRLDSLRKKDLTRGVLSATLNKYPERLVEIKDLADFKRVADMFDILVDIPPAAMKTEPASTARASSQIPSEQEAGRTTRKVSAAASQGVDVLPDEKPAGRRRLTT